MGHILFLSLGRHCASPLNAAARSWRAMGSAGPFPIYLVSVDFNDRALMGQEVPHVVSVREFQALNGSNHTFFFVTRQKKAQPIA